MRLHFRKSKTDEGLRSPVIVRSAPALLHYLQVHPQRDNPKAPLCGWCRKINPFGQKTCIQCLRPLTLRPEEVAIKTEWDRIFRKMGRKFLKENPEIERKFLERVGKG